MPKRKFHNAYSINHSKGVDLSKQESMTVPGETHTIRELVEKFAHGAAPPRDDASVYLDQEDLSKIDKFYRLGSLDLTDLEELNNRVNALQEQVGQAVDAKMQELQDADQIDAFDDPESESESESESKDKDE